MAGRSLTLAGSWVLRYDPVMLIGRGSGLSLVDMGGFSRSQNRLLGAHGAPKSGKVEGGELKRTGARRGKYKSHGSGKATL